ncbi:hypothetical protein ACOSQ4_010993 [Xanthoceras sorbifolium]
MCTTTLCLFSSGHFLESSFSYVLGFMIMMVITLERKMLETIESSVNGWFSQLQSCGNSSEEELLVLPGHTKVVVTGNNRTKSVLVGLQGVVKKAVGLGGWHWLPCLGRPLNKELKPSLAPLNTEWRSAAVGLVAAALGTAVAAKAANDVTIVAVFAATAAANAATTAAFAATHPTVAPATAIIAANTAAAIASAATTAEATASET